MQVKLIVRSGPENGREFLLKRPETIIGRQKGCRIRITAQEVSRRHCCVRITGNQVSVQDLGSVNGTFVNGFLISEESWLRPGDQLQVGPIVFQVDYAAEGEPLVGVPLDEGFELVDELPEAEEVIQVSAEVVDQGSAKPADATQKKKPTGKKPAQPPAYGQTPEAIIRNIPDPGIEDLPEVLPMAEPDDSNADKPPSSDPFQFL